MNYTEEALAGELHLPVRRWGGNSTTRYNWRTSMTNTASDWYFENLPEGTVNVATLPSGSASDQFVEQNRRTGTQTLLTVPLIGWTAKASSPRNHPYDCGFKVSRYGAQQSVDPWDTNCGNGVQQNGNLVLGNVPEETSDAIDPAFVQAWVAHLTGKYGTAAQQGVAFYALDNEPMLWNSTHRDIHPLPVSYDELRDRTYQYAAAVKAADPSAKTLGPVLWGWCAYLYSARDGCSPGIDYQTHGQQLFVPWYLAQMRAYEQAHQQRILDYLDLHYYPQANGVSLSTAGSAATQALRLRSTRSLWDATYTDESWIADTAAGGVKVQLIPRMRDWVNTFYPDTRLAITEYNWGGLESLNGALAQADVLGIFGRENLDLATLWSPPTPSQPGAFAFRMYRNYDGAGQGFGDQSMAALSSNQATLAIYAAQRSSDHALTMLVINKTATALTSPVTITGLSLPTTAAVYRYSAANLNAIMRVADQPLTSSGFSALYPANSITLVVMTPGSGAGTVALTVNKTGTGQGNVTPSSGTLTWTGATGTGAYSKGTAVTLSAIAATGSTFSHWTGCDSVNANTCTVSMTAAKSVTVTFTLNQYLLTATAAGSGAGSLAANGGGLSFTYPASKTGSVKINHGATVTLTATGTNGSTVSWSGTSGCTTVTWTTSNSVCTINNMTAARTAAATFTAPCTFNLSPTTKTFTKTGGNGSAKITASASTCAWTANSKVAWVTLTKASFTGSATVNYAVAKNTSGSKRTGTLTLAGKTLTITQTK